MQASLWQLRVVWGCPLPSIAICRAAPLPPQVCAPVRAARQHPRPRLHAFQALADRHPRCAELPGSTGGKGGRQCGSAARRPRLVPAPGAAAAAVAGARQGEAGLAPSCTEVQCIERRAVHVLLAGSGAGAPPLRHPMVIRLLARLFVTLCRPPAARLRRSTTASCWTPTPAASSPPFQRGKPLLLLAAVEAALVASRDSKGSSSSSSSIIGRPPPRSRRSTSCRRSCRRCLTMDTSLST